MHLQISEFVLKGFRQVRIYLAKAQERCVDAGSISCSEGMCLYFQFAGNFGTEQNFGGAVLPWVQGR